MNHKKNICIITSVHIPTDIRIYHKEARSLSKNYNVTILATGKKPMDSDGLVDWVILPRPKSRGERFTKTLYKILQVSLKMDACVYHLHDPELIPIGIILSLLNRNIVFDIHEDSFLQIQSKKWLPTRLRTVMAHLYLFLLNYAAKRFSSIITATDGIAETLDTKTCVLKNYPILGELSSVEGKSSRNVIAYLGGVAYNRGLSQRAAIGSTAICDVVIAGPFQHQAEREKFEKEGGFEFVKYLGRIDRPAVKCLLNDSFAGLVLLKPEPYFLESLPIKMFEYMEAGVPVIASDFPFWKALLEPYECAIFVDPDNLEQIIEAVEKLRSSQELVNHMGQNGKWAVQENFNWTIEEKKLLALYHKITKN